MTTTRSSVLALQARNAKSDFEKDFKDSKSLCDSADYARRFATLSEFPG